jgi:hypothetical protein
MSRHGTPRRAARPRYRVLPPSSPTSDNHCTQLAVIRNYLSQSSPVDGLIGALDKGLSNRTIRSSNQNQTASPVSYVGSILSHTPMTDTVPSLQFAT